MLKTVHVHNSRHSDSNIFIKIMDPKIISAIGAKIKDLSIIGAMRNGVVLGDVTIPLGLLEKTLTLMSTLKDWKDWERYK